MCHPHPQHGGTMHNKVVYRIARGLRRAGAVVLRFNYRGVNLSEGTYADGEGELEDARAALAVSAGALPHICRLRWPDFRLARGSSLRMGCGGAGATTSDRRGIPVRLPGPFLPGRLHRPPHFRAEHPRRIWAASRMGADHAGSCRSRRRSG